MNIIISLLPVAILLLLLWFGMHAIRRFANRYPPATDGSDSPSGVEGWLLFLVLGLTLLGPLLGAGRLSNEISAAETTYPALKTLDAWVTYKVATGLTYAIAAWLSIYAGIGLAKGRDMSVVRRAKILIWISGPVASVVLGVLVPLAIMGRSDPGPEFFGALASSVMASGIWTLYLSKSERVRATYSNHSPSPPEPSENVNQKVDVVSNDLLPKNQNHSSLWSQLALRTKAKLVSMLAAAVGIACFMVAVGIEYSKARDYLATGTVENQTFEYLKGIAPNRSGYDFSSLDRVLSEKGVASANEQSSKQPMSISSTEICAERVAAILDARQARSKYAKATSDLKQVSKSPNYEAAVSQVISEDLLRKAAQTMSVLQRQQVLQEKACQIVEQNETALGHMDLKKGVVGLILATVVSFVWLAAVFWIFSYPHLGWKRVAVVVGVISIPAAFMQASINGGTLEGILSLAAVCFVGIPLLLLTAREVWLWIGKGFSDSHVP